MEKVLGKVSDSIFVITKYILIFLVSEMTLLIGVNVCLRFIFNTPFYWVEEVSRYSFIWATFLGTALCFQKRSLIGVTLIISKVKVEYKKYACLMIEVVITFVLVLSVVFGIKMTIITAGQLAPITHISMSFVYLSIPISSVIMLISNINFIIVQTKQKEALVNWGEC